MNKIAEMRAKVETLKANATAILDAVEADGRQAMNDQEQSEYDRLDKQITSLSADIAAAEQLAEARRQMAPTGARPAMSLTTSEPDPATTGGFRSLGEFAAAVRSAAMGVSVDRRLAAPTNVHEGNGSSGEGYLIPSEYRNNIWNVVDQQDSLLNRFNPVPTAARTINYIKDETTPWGAAGVSASWRVEGSQMTPSKLETNGAMLQIHDLFAFAAVTEEMLDDAPLMENHLTEKAAQAIAYKAGEAIMWGDGVGKPLGFMNSNALVTVAKESGQSAATLVATNVDKMYSRQLMTQGADPFWLANIDIFPQLRKLESTSGEPLFLPPGGFSVAPYGQLLGRPILFTEHAETLGTAGDLVLVNPAGYLAARRSQGPQFAQSMHLWFDYAISAFRWTFRLGGTPLLSAPVTPDKGSATRSHFVALATRS